MSEIETTVDHITIKEYLTRYNVDEMVTSLAENDIVIFPENFMNKDCFSKDLINLAKILRNNGLKVDFFKSQSPIIEKRSADIMIYLGIVTETVVLPLTLGVIGNYVYERFVKSKEKKSDIPNVRLEYYKKDSEEKIKYEGPADKLADYLTKLKEK